MASYDVVVAGLGAAGSAALYHLARRGHRVLGMDRLAPPHDAGSSHGKSRIIREAYFEDPRYVPLVQRAYSGWADLEGESGVTLLRRTGGLMLGPPDGALVRGALHSAALHRLPHELLSAAEVRERIPALAPDDDMVGVWEPRAGVLAPEKAIAAALACAARHGASVHMNEPLVSWRRTASGIEAVTPDATYRAARLVVAVGAWTKTLLASLNLPLVVERNAVFWFDPARHAERFSPDRFPIFMCENAPNDICYGFPNFGDGVKFARHHHGATCDAESVNRNVAHEEVAAMRALAARYLPDANGPLRETTVCLYTNTPDEHFIIDTHPDAPEVIVASPCSGHGFKFAPVIGEIIADLAAGVAPPFDIAGFSLSRFG